MEWGRQGVTQQVRLDWNQLLTFSRNLKMKSKSNVVELITNLKMFYETNCKICCNLCHFRRFCSSRRWSQTYRRRKKKRKRRPNPKKRSKTRLQSSVKMVEFEAGFTSAASVLSLRAWRISLSTLFYEIVEILTLNSRTRTGYLEKQWVEGSRRQNCWVTWC